MGYDILPECLRNNKGYGILLEYLTKTRGMIYSSNVSLKNKGCDILPECLGQKQGLWYTPRMSQTKTRGMIYSSSVSDKNRSYGMFLECLREKQGA
jgi:hypothetical protein